MRHSLECEQPYLFKTIRFPRDLWAELEAIVPARGRSAIVQEALRRELKRRQRRQVKAGQDGEGGGTSGESADGIQEGRPRGTLRHGANGPLAPDAGVGHGAVEFALGGRALGRNQQRTRRNHKGRHS